MSKVCLNGNNNIIQSRIKKYSFLPKQPLQKLWPQFVVTGSYIKSWQMAQENCSGMESVKFAGSSSGQLPTADIPTISMATTRKPKAWSLHFLKFDCNFFIYILYIKTKK